MKKALFFVTVALAFFGNISFTEPKSEKRSTNERNGDPTSKTDDAHALTYFIPKGYIINEKISGDLNNDHLEDLVLLIKGTNKQRVIKDRFRNVVDRNRRGIIVLFKSKNGYELAIKNYDCFSSENEDGGVYIPPELDLSIEKGNLHVHYGHGRYGYWEYTFRFQHADLELIGYDDSDDRGPVINNETSINYLTKNKIVKENTNEAAEGGQEVFKTTRSKINIIKLIKLSTIRDFDNLDTPGL